MDISEIEPVGFMMYKDGVLVTWADPYEEEKMKKGRPGKRERITRLTDKSLRKLAFVAQNTDAPLRFMTTLTYPREFPTNGHQVKKHLNAFLTWCRYKDDDLYYLWFLEFQSRGAPHIHILHSYPSWSKGELSARWYKICGTGDERHLRAGTRLEKLRDERGAAKYATKYACKPEQKVVPDGFKNVGRFWGCSRNVKPVPIAAAVIKDREQLIEALDGWFGQERLRRGAMSYLYGASKFIKGIDVVMIDRRFDSCTE